MFINNLFYFIIFSNSLEGKFNTIFQNTTNVANKICFETIIGGFLPTHETLLFIYNSNHKMLLPQYLNYPRILIEYSAVLNMEVGSYSNYIIFTENFQWTVNILKNIKNSLLWNSDVSPYANFIIIYRDENDTGEFIIDTQLPLILFIKYKFFTICNFR